eukprot:CAMPEP_0114510576 /NCGR_PEP_ID=MMETSP0109-20121206/13879_1 /TAXON_ID=29199 /ORGANISM="Chlorarachnion reptans, Strain CCCM449" /LENGTH=77 /DNA_ID=CAMNT_0001689929 /DNA_START=699 /DNA_END=932 /DNA_ORIENTATION=-
MTILVLFAVAPIREPLPTVPALVWFLSRVRTNMSPQVAVAQTPIFTMRALHQRNFVPVVHASVLDEVATVEESLVTD